MERPQSDTAGASASSASASHQEAVERFVQFWGEMASNWGINRTMAQIHALLYCSEDPLNTDDIMEQLEISRGNANMNLRSLVEWNLIDKVRLAESRKDFYVAEKDVWQITAQIIKEREEREIRPVREELEECRDLLPEADAGDVAESDAVLRERFDNLIRLMDVFEGFSEALLPFVEERNVEMIRHLIMLTRSIQEPESSDLPDSLSQSD